MANQLLDHHDDVHDPLVTPDGLERDAAPPDNTPADPTSRPIEAAPPQAPGSPDAGSESSDPGTRSTDPQPTGTPEAPAPPTSEAAPPKTRQRELSPEGRPHGRGWREDPGGQGRLQPQQSQARHVLALAVLPPAGRKPAGIRRAPRSSADS